MRSIEIIPTIVPGSLDDVREVSEKYSGFASKFQIDLADGRFAPNTTWLPNDDFVLSKNFNYEVHMMVEKPAEIGTRFAKAGATTLIAHAEVLTDLENARDVFAKWRAAGAHEIGIAVLFHTPLEQIEHYLPLVDFVLLMTIPRIGVMGIPYEASAPARVAQFRALNPTTTIAVDGGVSEANIIELARAGATRFGVGSAIAKAADPKSAYEKLAALAESALV